MKHFVMSVILVLALAFLTPSLAESAPEKALTLMIYMCGSNLESQYGSACADIEEMRKSGVDTEAVNVLLLTGGSSYWHTGQDAGTLGIQALKYSQRSGENRWVIEQTLPSRSMGDAQTLANFIGWSVENHPAAQYALILWDHGAGPLEGICLDELNAPDRLNIDELARALGQTPLPGKLSWIGMDACLMATAEVAKAVAPYAQYMIASQETEPADGWDYGFLSGIEADAEGSTTGKRIVDAYFESQGEDAMGLTLSCLDLSRIDALSEAMSGFFEPIGRAMNKDEFTRLSTLRTQSASYGKVVRGLTADGYDLVDLGDLITHYSAFRKDYLLEAALEAAVVYKRPDVQSVSGISVYHPLRNKTGYQNGWKQVYAQLNFCTGYQKYLNSFGTILTGRELADWSQIFLNDDGFSPAGENLYSMQMTPVQVENFASAQLIVLGAVQGSGDEAVYNTQLSEAGAATGADQLYYPVLIDDVTPDEGGTLSARYTGRSLYLTDESGRAVAGPIGYQRSDDGEFWYVGATYYDWSGRENAADDAQVLYTCALDEASGALKVVNTEVYDSLTQTYTRRIGFDEAEYTEMYIERLARAIPESEGALPGFADWEGKYSSIEVSLPLKWQLRFFDEQMSGIQLFATLQITDLQQNSYCTPPIRLENPNLYNIDIQPRQITGNGFDLTLYAVQDSSPLNPGLNIGAAFRNTSHQTLSGEINDFVLNGHRADSGIHPFDFFDVAPGQTAYASTHLESAQLAGMGELTEISFEMQTRIAGASVSDSDRRVCTVTLSGCDASVMDNGAFAPLGEVVMEDQTWQLLDLKRNARGGLSGMLRVINDGGELIHGKYYLILNNCLQTDQTLYFSVNPYMDACVPFEIENSIQGTDLRVTAAQTSSHRYLGIDHLIERFGITELTSLKLCKTGDGGPDAKGIAFEWAEPIPIADVAQIGRYQPLGEAQRLLLDGDFTVNVDRVLAGDNGVALRLLITNHTDRDLNIKLKYPMINGETAYFAGLYGLFDKNEYAVGAAATLVANVSIEKSDIESVDALSLCFRYADYTTHAANIIPDVPLRLGAEGGTYLSASDIHVRPVDNVRPSLGGINVTPRRADIAGVAMSLYASLVNEETAYREDVDGSTCLKIAMMAENRSENKLDFELGDFVVNGTRYVGGIAFIHHVAPGEASDCTVKIGAMELANLDRIDSVECRVKVRGNQDGRDAQEYNIRYGISGIPLSGTVPEMTVPLGKSQASDISLRVMSLQEDDRGRLQGVLYLRNDTDVALEDEFARICINGVQGNYAKAVLAGKTDRFIGFSFDNAVNVGYAAEDFKGNAVPDMSRLLQRMGMDAVYNVGLLANHDGVDGVLMAALDAPMPLSHRDDADLAQPKPLLEGNVFAGVTHIAMTGKGLFLTLVIRNDSSQPHELCIFTCEGDGCALEVSAPNRFALTPGLTQVVNVQFPTDKSLAGGEGLERLDLRLAADGALLEGSAICMGEPLTVGKAELRAQEAFDTTAATTRRPMPAILESVGVPDVQSVHAMQLVAPLDAREVQRFDHGYACICVRDKVYVKDESGASVERPCLRELCRIPLVQDAERLIARYSGMVLWDGYKALYAQQLSPDGIGTAFQSQLVLYSPDHPYDSKLSGRLDARGYGILADGCWMVNTAESGPALLDAVWALHGLEAGAEAPAEMPPAADGWKVFGDQPLYFDGDIPDTWDVVGIYEPTRLEMIPVQALDAELVVRYALFYTDGESETIIADDMAAMLADAQAQPGVPENLGELEPDGGGSFAVTPDAYETERFRVSVSARLMLEDVYNSSWDMPAELKIRLGLCMKVENRSDIKIDALSTNLVLNGAHETDTQWIALGIKPQTAFADTWYIEPEDMLAVGSVRRIQCVLNLCGTDKNSEIVESIPIDVTLEPTDEAALWERYEAVGETGVYGVTWQLLSADIDEYGRVTGTLNAINHTSNTWDLSNNAVLANGYRGTSVLPDFQLEPNSSKTLNYAFENFAWADSNGEAAGEVPQTRFILQSHGVRQVTELTFALGIVYDFHRGCMAAKQTLTFELPEPLAIPPTDYVPGAQKLLMQSDGLTVWLESVLMGEETISLALEVRNDTDRFYDLDLEHINLNGNHVYWWNWKEYALSTVLPHTIQNGCITAYLTDDEYLTEDGIGDVHLCFAVMGEGEEIDVYRAARVVPENPLEGAGELVRADACAVQPATFAGAYASGLIDALCLPSATQVHPRTLTPPISPEKAALFESGEVSICLRYDYDGYDDGDLSCQKLSQEIARLELARDSGGVVSAQYSGMALTFCGAPFPMRERTQRDQSEISATVYYFKDYYDAYEIHDPGTDGGTPDIVSVGAPSYAVDEPRVTAPAVKVELDYRVNCGDGALACRGAQTAFVDMQTGKALEGGVIDWMYHSLMICDTWRDDDYDRTFSTCMEFGSDTSLYPCLMPIERVVRPYWDGTELMVRYHLRYADGSEETLTEAY